MGNQQQKSVQKENLVHNTHYGGNVIHNHRTNTIYQQFLIEQRHLEKFMKLVEGRKLLKHPNLITIKNYFKKESDNKGICSNDQKIQFFVEYQYIEDSLSELLDKASEQGRFLNQIQIKRIFTPVVQCLIYLRDNKTCHGDIKPSSILLDKFGNVKLLDSYFMNGGKTSYQIVMQNPSSMSLLSPQQLQRLKDRQFDSIQNIYSNEIFALGLTMYQALTYEPAMQCYDLVKLKVKEKHFQNLQKIIASNGYSQKLGQTLKLILTSTKQKRMSFQQLLKVLKS